MKKGLFREIPYDQYTPITAYHALAGKGACILESSPQKDRYSFVGFDPIVSITGKDDYVEALRELKKQYPIEADHPLALYAGAPVGYVTYDRDYFFQIYRSAVSFDHQMGRAALFTLGSQEELERLYQKLREGKALDESPIEIGEIQTDRSDEEFVAMVERAKEHLRAGDIFQIVLSRTFQASFKGNPFQFYRLLRHLSPAPYQFFFDLTDFAIAGASPEKIISVQGREIESMPIAGTRGKNGSPFSLLNDPKELAEHVMLVDLARNDLGAVSVPGSVKVAEFKIIREFSHVNHMISRVTSQLDERYDALDVLKASFPAGTLTGAPKIRAMELIEEIESSKRGLYGGAIVALDAKGNLASCIAIRTAVLKEGTLLVRAGAGIVLDSDPLKEAAETFLKANTVLEVAHVLNHR